MVSVVVFCQPRGGAEGMASHINIIAREVLKTRERLDL
jgi:ATP-dependent protease ClpP protease subunit